MGHLGTHVLDTMHGRHAAGTKVSPQRLRRDAAQTIRQFIMNADGRNSDGPPPDCNATLSGRYRLLFEMAPCLRAWGVVLPEHAFLDIVPLDAGSIADPGGHYHAPLLATPWCYSIYRGR